MNNSEISPPWIQFPEYPPAASFWRREGESWALIVWLPYWSQLSDSERQNLLDQYEAPEEWRDFYTKEHQEFIAEQDGPAGWILRNNLTPCSPDKTTYVSVSQNPLRHSRIPQWFSSPWFKRITIIVIASIILFVRDYWSKIY